MSAAATHDIISVHGNADLSPRGLSSAASTAASSDAEREIPKAQPTKLFVGGLTQNTTTKLLRAHFSRYGNVMDCIAMRQPDGKPRGFGYVTLESREAANAAVKETQRVDGRVLDVKLAVRGRDGKDAKVQKSSERQPHKKASASCPCCGESLSLKQERHGGITLKNARAPTSTSCGKKAASYDFSGMTGAAHSWNPSWASSWGYDCVVGAYGADITSSIGDAATPSFIPMAQQPVAPPPGLEHPSMKVSLFRTPSPSECSSRSSSLARSEARFA
mmetsp:Transcript_57361/g.166562  ORF Transcript_57361/g.166562 Transcript_57361/m.166562 type:complete len:275 (-) Transcript_57361:192-1016(-)